jgi:response regulator RpfG family c-di-GMP phosphodiesterase
VNLNHRRGRVVIVDDEEMVLASVAGLLKLEGDYEVTAFQQPADAIAYAKSHPVDLVVADYIMPEMNGLQLLAEIKQLQPQATRVLLTGYADKSSAIQAINDVGLYQYIEKPWDSAVLLLTVRNGVEKAHLLQDLQDKIAGLDAAHQNLKDVQAKLMKAFL